MTYKLAKCVLHDNGNMARLDSTDPVRLGLYYHNRASGSEYYRLLDKSGNFVGWVNFNNHRYPPDIAARNENGEMQIMAIDKFVE